MKRFVRHILPPLAAGAILGALTACLLLSRALVLDLFGRRDVTPVPPSGEVWTLETAEGLTLRACAGEAGEGRNWVILLHGLEGSAVELEDLARACQGRGWSTLIPELRGCGGTGGRFRSLGTGDGAEILAWMRQIREACPVARLVLYGRGLGANAALAASGTRPEGLAAVVAEDPVPSLGELGEEYLPRGSAFLGWGVNLWLRLTVGRDLLSLCVRRQTAGTGVPILFLDGPVPAGDAEALYRCAGKKARLLRAAGQEEREEAVLTFLTGCSGWSQTR